MLQDQPCHQADQRFSRILRQVGPIGRRRRAGAGKQIHLSGSWTQPAPAPNRCRLPRHGSLPDSGRERLHMRPEAGHSMMARWSSTLGRATRTIRRALPDRRTPRPQSAPRTRIRRNRTSRRESPATVLGLSRPTCSGKRQSPCRSRRERKRRARTTDGADKEQPAATSCGRSQTVLYNHRRPHQSLGDRTPMAVWREAVAGTGAADMMDNASALPTRPQPQNQTQPLAA